MENMKILAEAKKLWMKLNLRGAIVTSLSLQVFLIFFAPIRKRLSNRWTIMFTWSAYLVADWVADYAFGLISKAQISGHTSDSEADAYDDLLAFWAPFLLLHLGGPDTITAFALEDNELWGRHLLNLLFQLAIAGYAFYQSLPSNKLIVPTILMFIAGTIKYIERTCSLYHASFSRLRGSLLTSADIGQKYDKLMEVYISMKKANIPASFEIPALNIGSTDDGNEDKNNLDDREVIKAAFFYFTTFKGLLVDGIFSFRERNQSRKFFSGRTAKDAFRVIEAELNFFYDALYTKVATVHCPTGYLFRAISIGSIITAFALFYVLNKHGFHKYDIQITYTLLLGAVALEFVALVMLICSDLTIANIGTSETRCRSLFKGSIFISFFKFKSESSPFALHVLNARWSKSIYQYNLIESQLRKWSQGTEKLFGLIPLPELLDYLRSGRQVKYSEELGVLIFNELKRKSRVAVDPESIIEMCAARGKWALMHPKTGLYHEDLLPFIRVDYGESLLLWHIATEFCYNNDERTKPNTDRENSKVNTDRENSKILSDYMLHLMIKQPAMMSAVAGIGQIRIQDTCAEMEVFFAENIFNEREQNKMKKNACASLLSAHRHVNPADVEGATSKSVLFDACILANELDKLGET